MALPFKYHLGNLGVRRTSTWLTVLGIAMVVLMFCVIQALSQGLDSVLVSTGREDNLLVLRPGSNTEINSSISRESFRVLSSLEDLAKGPDGRTLCVAEHYLTVYLRRDETSRTNIALRGTTERALTLRPAAKITEGRIFRPSAQEIVVGRAATRRFPQLQMGGTLTFEKRDWKIVGIFDADGQAYESEIWGDVEDVGNAFKRSDFNSVLLRAKGVSERDVLGKKIEDNPQLKLRNLPESKYFAEQFETGMPLSAIGGVITALLAIGATFGAMNTMYSAVASRTREIAVLRAIGYGRWTVLLAFVLESTLIALIGGLAGCTISLAFNGIQSGTMNWFTFTEMAFQFKVTPQILTSGILFSVFLGAFGGFFPAMRAARMTIMQALRAV